MALESIKLANGVDFTFIPSNCFKTTYIAFNFLTELRKETAAANSLTAALMKSETGKYPDLYSLNRKLASLYGASTFNLTSKSGDWQELTLGILVNDSKFSLCNEDTVMEAAELLHDMILGRYFNNTPFSNEAIAREKRLLIEKQEGKLNDKRVYARNRLIEEMCKNEPFGLSADGTVDEIKALSDHDINAALKSIVENSYISVMVIGSKEPKGFKDLLTQNFKKVNRNFTELSAQMGAKASDPIKTATDKMAVNQGKLVLGLRGKLLGSYKDSVKARIMNDVFGGGPYSKLFCNVREKLSLCYYCRSIGVWKKGVILIDSGVEQSNIDSAKDAILKEFNNVKNGIFDDKDIEFSKLAMKDMIISSLSDQFQLANFYNERIIEGKIITPNDAVALIDSVTKEDIIEAAKDFDLDTVYTLIPENEN